MQELLKTGIKDVIRLFPEIGKILDEFGIGCAPCSVGDCLLKDIVSIHNLSPDQERTIMARITKAVYPEREVEIPRLTTREIRSSAEFRYSPPVKKLVDEHTLIKRCIARMPDILENLDLESCEGRSLVLDTAGFIRNYADRFHHAKEEDILFQRFDPDLDIIQVMHKDHDTGRAHIRAVLDAVERRDTASVRENLGAWSELLTQHIKKEDEILFPWMDRQFNTSQIGELFSQFAGVDIVFGDQPQLYTRFVESLEERFRMTPEPLPVGD